MAFTYTTLANISRIVRSILKFSDSIYILSKHDGNVGTIEFAFSGLTMNAAYKGFHTRFELRFLDGTDPTHYRIYKQVSTEGSTNLVYLTDGYTSVTKVITDTMTIATAGWSGVADVSRLPTRFDLIIIETESHYSNNEVEMVENDVEYTIDEMLRAHALFTDAETTAPYFVTIPRLIKIATEYFTAFRLVDDYFKATRQYNSLVGKEEPNNPTTIAYGWVKEGVKAVAQYIKSRETMAGNTPRWHGPPPLMTKIGLEDVGYISDGNDVDNIDSINDLTGLLDYYLSTASLSSEIEYPFET